MPWPYSLLIPSFWVLWLLYWIVASFGAKPRQRTESTRSRLSHLLPLLVGGLLMGVPRALPGVLDVPLVPSTPAWLIGATVLVVLGLGFSAAGRARLGRNWSSLVTLKTGHELIRSGPYSYVRHPIYSGLLLALLGTALALGTERALLGIVFMIVAFVRKLTLEERFMAEQFGQSYARYRAEVAALIPFVY